MRRSLLPENGEWKIENGECFSPERILYGGFILPANLLDVNLDAIGFVAIHVQHHINFATAGQAARDAQVELIEALKSA